ncbi:unnamed protein product [Oncorhynchus mykiss]|uniref:Uncharacterized protein n=1 Tax=Oncorhynchus mykiss TaxID=8022 RepID=A0A060W5X9_ONCMY|nr:unnamed protein product [Oncorhynchus mykiss]
MRVRDYLNDKYTDPKTDELLTIATFLDPRFKTTYITTEKLVEVKVRAASETEALLVGNTDVGDFSLEEDQSGKEAGTAPQSAKKSKKSLGSFLKKTSSAPALRTQRQVIEQELDSYTLMMAADSEADPLDW